MIYVAAISHGGMPHTLQEIHSYLSQQSMFEGSVAELTEGIDQSRPCTTLLLAPEYGAKKGQL